MNARADIVVTGTGAVTALGFGVRVNVDALAVGESGVRPADGAYAACASIEAPYLRCDVAEDLESQIKFLNPSSQLGVTAMVEALAQSGGITAFADIAPERRSLYLAQVDCADWDCREIQAGVAAAIGSGDQPLEPAKVNKLASRRSKPFFLLEGLKNNAFSFLATWFETRGPNTAFGGVDMAGLHAIDRAVAALASGISDVAFVVGAAFASEPIVRREVHDLHVDTFVPADGAGALVLERRADAERRGARIRGAVRVVHDDLDEEVRVFDVAEATGSLSAAAEPASAAIGLASVPERFAVVSRAPGDRVGAVVLDPVD